MHETHVQMTNKREWWLLLYSLVHHTTIPLSTYTRYEYINIYYVYIFIWFIFIIINKRLSVILEYNNTSTRCHECTCLLSHTITCIKQELGIFLTAGYKCDTCKYEALVASMLQWMVIWCLAIFFFSCHGSNVQHHSGHVSTLYISVSVWTASCRSRRDTIKCCWSPKIALHRRGKEKNHSCTNWALMLIDIFSQQNERSMRW